MLNIFDKIEQEQKTPQNRKPSQQVYSNALACYINEYLSFAEKQQDKSVYDYISANYNNIKRLIKMGANINLPYRREKSTTTILGFAMQYKHFELIELLIQNGAILDQIFFANDGDTAYTAFEYANQFFTQDEKQKFFEICENYGYKIPNNNFTNQQTDNSETLWLMIANSTEKEIIDFIQTHDINPNFCKNQKSLLQLLIENKKSDAMFALLDKGADINQPFSDHQHAIIHIFKNDMFSRQLFDKLLDYGLDVNYQNKRFGTPLILDAIILCNQILSEPSEQAKEFFMALIDNNVDCRAVDYKNEDVWKKLIYCSDFIKQQVEQRFPKHESISRISNDYFTNYEQFEQHIEENLDLLDQTTEKSKYFIINACEDFVPDCIINHKHAKIVNKILRHPYALPQVVVFELSYYHNCTAEDLKFILSYKPDPNSVHMQKALQNFLTDRNFECAETLIAYGTKLDSYYLTDNFCQLHNVSENTFNLIKQFAENQNEDSAKHNPKKAIENLYSQATDNVYHNKNDDQIEA